jgi:hypothetical protein
MLLEERKTKTASVADDVNYCELVGPPVCRPGRHCGRSDRQPVLPEVAVAGHRTSQRCRLSRYTRARFCIITSASTEAAVVSTPYVLASSDSSQRDLKAGSVSINVRRRVDESVSFKRRRPLNYVNGNKVSSMNHWAINKTSLRPMHARFYCIKPA